MTEPENAENVSVKNNNENSYRSILKGTSLMGGVQVFQIIISLIRGKFAAMLLGPEGMGINSIFTSASTSITQFSSLGLNSVLVKEIPPVKENQDKLNSLVRSVLSILHISGAVAALLCVLFSSLLSNISFGSNEFAWQFMLLGVALYLYTVAFGKLAVIQGLHKLKLVSKASLLAALSSLVLGVPLYYFFGNHGIVPAIVIIAATSLICYSRALTQAVPNFSLRTSFIEGKKSQIKPLIKLGLLLISPAIIASACQYGLNIFIRMAGSIDDVGLFNAANSITNQYSSLVIAAMAIEYLPRLSAAKSDNGLMINLVNRQTEIVALIITPVVTAVILSAPIIIQILLSSEFNSISNLIRWMALGISLKTLSFPMGYIAFAKDNKKLFFWLESILGNLLYLIISFPAFIYFGIIGMGYALVAENACIIIIYYLTNHHFYRYNFSLESIKWLIIAVVSAAATLFASFIANQYVAYSLMTVIFILISILSFYKLRILLKKTI